MDKKRAEKKVKGISLEDYNNLKEKLDKRHKELSVIMLSVFIGYFFGRSYDSYMEIFSFSTGPLGETIIWTIFLIITLVVLSVIIYRD